MVKKKVQKRKRETKKKIKQTEKHAIYSAVLSTIGVWIIFFFFPAYSIFRSLVGEAGAIITLIFVWLVGCGYLYQSFNKSHFFEKQANR